MFEHLDDPTPPGGDLDSVLLRARGRRRRRRVRAVLGTSLAVVVIGALAVGVAAGGGGESRRAPPRRLSASEIAFEYRQRADPLPIGTAVPTSALADVVFVGPTDGFALAVHRQRSVLAETTDAGAAWQVVNPRLPMVTEQDGAGAEMEFTDLHDGYLWDSGDGTTPTAPLWVTSDGGISWQRAPIGPVVFDVSAIGTDVWAVVGSCSLTVAGTGAGPATPGDVGSAGPGGPAGTAESTGTAGSTTPVRSAGTAPTSETTSTLPVATCPLELELSLDGGVEWQQAASGIPAGVAETSSPSTSVELARITPTRAYVISDFPPASAAPVLAFTADGGTTWVSKPAPCAAPTALGAVLAASSTDDLWLFCRGQSTGGSQDKVLFRSDDGGTQWAEAAAAGGLGGSPVSTPTTGSVPLAGYLGIGHLSVAVASPSAAWLFLQRGRAVLVTGDGGSAWQPVTGLPVGDPIADGAPGNITFISDTQGWLCELGAGLWRTTDGMHWTRLGG